MSCAFEVDDGVAIITLNRPEVLNAFDDELGEAALSAVRKGSEDESVRCIAITGAGRAFSSGEDLGALADGYKRGEVPELGRTLTDRYNPLIQALRAAPKPVIAAVNGVAAGAGCSVALACDFRVASEHAKLVLAFVKVGLVPDARVRADQGARRERGGADARRTARRRGARADRGGPDQGSSRGGSGLLREATAEFPRRIARPVVVTPPH